MSRRLLGALAVAMTVAGARLHPQSTELPQFEVASVKRNVSADAEGSIGGQPNGRFVVSNVPLRFILQVTYDVPAFRLSGGPKWIDVERYDIQGQAASAASNQQLSAMMRALLAERFKLRAHTETRTVAGFALVRARQDGRFGPQLRSHPEPCPSQSAPARETASGGLPPCGMISGSDRVIRISARPITDLATHLSRRLARPVTDRTGLGGLFDVQLEWAADARSSAPLAQPGSPIDDSVSVFTALQEQLGLKLQNERAEAEFLVIDSIEHPTDD
jgi:uncharacterized protein (TIGR03435 family)